MIRSVSFETLPSDSDLILTYLHGNSVWPEPEVGLATDDGLGLRVVQMRVEDLLGQGQGPTKLPFHHIKGLKVIHECLRSAHNEFSHLLVFTLKKESVKTRCKSK